MFNESSAASERPAAEQVTSRAGLDPSRRFGRAPGAAPRLPSLDAASKESAASYVDMDVPAPGIGRASLTVSAGYAGAEGTLVVKQAAVYPGKEPVVISDAQAVQVGDDNRMRNEHSFKVASPTVSLAGLAEGNRQAQRAFERVVQHPSRPAVKAFQRALEDRPVLTGGMVKAGKLDGPGVRRVPVESTSRYPVVVHRSAAVQIGDGGTMRNKFEYRVVKPELSAEAALRRDPDSVRALAAAARNPRAKSSWQALARQLEQACSRLSGPVKGLRGTYQDMFPDGASGHGVQCGIGNKRIDTVDIQARRLTVTGPPDSLCRPPLVPPATREQATRAPVTGHTVSWQHHLAIQVTQSSVNRLIVSAPSAPGIGEGRPGLPLKPVIPVIRPARQPTPPVQPGSRPRRPGAFVPEVKTAAYRPPGRHRLELSAGDITDGAQPLRTVPQIGGIGLGTLGTTSSRGRPCQHPGCLTGTCVPPGQRRCTCTCSVCRSSTIR